MTFSRLKSLRPTGSFLCMLLLALTLGLSACSSTHPDSFGEFSASIHVLRQNADAALAVNDSLSRDRYITNTVAASFDTLSADQVLELQMLQVEGDPFAWEMDPTPLFMAAKRFRTGVYSLNTTLVAYAELLAELAGAAPAMQARFDTLSTELNAGLNSAAKTIGVADLQQELAIFSAAARGVLNLYFENKQQSTLREALTENQENIEQIAAALQEAMRINALNLWQDYDERSMEVIRQLTPDAGGDPEARRWHVITAVGMNEILATRLAILETLHHSYGTLPVVHTDLVASVGKQEFSKASLRELYETSRHLRDLYREMAGNQETLNASRGAAAAGSTDE